MHYRIEPYLLKLGKRIEKLLQTEKLQQQQQTLTLKLDY